MYLLNAVLIKMWHSRMKFRNYVRPLMRVYVIIYNSLPGHLAFDERVIKSKPFNPILWIDQTDCGKPNWMI